MNKKTNGDDQGNQRIAPLKARAIIFGTVGGAAFRALAILRGVRRAGQENLGLRESIATALEQGAAVVSIRKT